MKKKTAIFIFFLFLSYICNAQKTVAYNNQQWFQYFNQLRLTNKLTLNSDFSLRKINNFNEWSQTTLRAGLGYQIIENLQGISGMAYFNFYNKNKINRIEFRPYQEINSTQMFGKISLLHRFRVEARYFRNVSERIFMSNASFNFRFRYRIFGTIPILKLSETKLDRKLLLNIGNELFINVGKQIVYNMFDNNRFLVGLALQTNSSLTFAFSYMNQFGQRNRPASYENSDILILAVIHKISLCKPKIAAQ